MIDGRADDATKAALGNKIVLRQIFCCLPFSDLKHCRLVNGTWYFEATSFIRDFRRCDASISEYSPCSDLLALAQVVSGMKIVPINGLKVELGKSSHSDCKYFGETEQNLHANLTQMLPLKHLHVAWDTAFTPLSCPAVNFVVDLLRRKTMELSTLELTRLPKKFLTYFGQVWVPWLPKLTSLEIGKMWSVPSQSDVFLRIINGAPNLKALRADGVDPETLEILPEAKYSLLKEFTFSMVTDVDERNCLKLAAAEPGLSYLWLAAPLEFDQQFTRRCFNILERLLSSSSKSLEEFCMSTPIFPLSLLSFPPMIKVKSIDVFAEPNSPCILNVLRATNYPKLFPVLSKVTIDVNGEWDPDDSFMNPWVNEDEVSPLVQVSPSTTVKRMEISSGFDLLTIAELSHIFPNVAKLCLWGGFGQPTHLAASAMYRDLWASWPFLESVSLRDYSPALKWNFDAEFLGINSEEVEILRQLDDETLEKMNIPSVRPSVLTSSRKSTKLTVFHFCII